MSYHKGFQDIRIYHYEPELNPVYCSVLNHYQVIADPVRVRDPNRKGTVECAIPRACPYFDHLHY